MAVIAVVSLVLGYYSWQARMRRLSRSYFHQSNHHVSQAHIVASRAYEERLKGDQYQQMALAAAVAGDEEKAEQLKRLAAKSRENFNELNWRWLVSSR
jgi:hypothetical protein